MTNGEAGDRLMGTKGGRSKDSLLWSWNEVVSLRKSAQQFNGRLMRTAPVVADLAIAYPGWRDALQVVNVLVHNLSLARAVLERMPLPDGLMEEAEA
jgi:hypothetical protein